MRNHGIVEAPLQSDDALLDGGGVEIGEGRGVWVQVAVGGVTVNGQTLAEGDGLAVEDESSLEIVGGAERSEVLLFDLA